MPTVRLLSKEGEVMEIDLEVVKKSGTIKTMLETLMEETPADEETKEWIPVPNVTNPILRKVVEWMVHHKDDLVDEEDGDKRLKMSDWDKKFLDVDSPTLYQLMMAANYLDIKELLHLTTKKAANVIRSCQTPQEIRNWFNLSNDFSPETEEQIRRQNEWCNGR